MESIESLVRNIIQKHKNDMANEIIDAGRFDQTTTMDERRANLEALLQVGAVWRLREHNYIACVPGWRHDSVRRTR